MNPLTAVVVSSKAEISLRIFCTLCILIVVIPQFILNDGWLAKISVVLIALVLLDGVWRIREYWEGRK